MGPRTFAGPSNPLPNNLMLLLFLAKPKVGLGRTETSLGSIPVPLTASSSNMARPLSAMPVPRGFLLSLLSHRLDASSARSLCSCARAWRGDSTILRKPTFCSLAPALGL